MLSRKGTISRKNRASMRRGRGGRGGGPGGGGGGGVGLNHPHLPCGSGSSSTLKSGVPRGGPLPLSTTFPTSPSMKSHGSKEVSFSSFVDNHTYIMDTVSTSGDINCVDGQSREDSSAKDSIFTPRHLGNVKNNLSSTDILGYNYQSIAQTKAPRMTGNDMADTSSNRNVENAFLAVAEGITIIALMIMIYTFLGHIIFREGFFRQMAYIFQFTKIFLIFAGLLPCVLHCQIEKLLPGTIGTSEFYLIVLLFLIGNILFALGLERLIMYLWTYNSLPPCKCSSCCKMHPWKESRCGPLRGKVGACACATSYRRKPTCVRSWVRHRNQCSCC